MENLNSPRIKSWKSAEKKKGKREHYPRLSFFFLKSETRVRINLLCFYILFREAGNVSDSATL